MIHKVLTVRVLSKLSQEVISNMPGKYHDLLKKEEIEPIFLFDITQKWHYCLKDNK